LNEERFLPNVTMVDFQPIRGLIPQLASGESIGSRVSPPYDVISPQEADALRSNPYNITRVTLGGRDGNYAAAARELESWIASGALLQDGRPCFYMYRQSFDHDGRELSRSGIIGALRAEGYASGMIIPHEETFPKVKEDRLELLRATRTHCESIFGLYDSLSPQLRDEAFSRAEPLFKHVDQDGSRHELARISDPSVVAAITAEMASKRVLIADGHHRFETACKYAAENEGDELKAYVLCTLVSSEDKGMFVRPTHRLISGLKAGEAELLSKLSELFAVAEAADEAAMTRELEASKAPALGVILPSGKRLVAAYEQAPKDELWEVDAYIFQEVLLKKVLQPLSDVSVGFDHDASAVERAVASGSADLGVIVKAPSLRQTWKVALAGLKMPKKTTFFWPKIWSGFVLYRMK